MMVTLRTGLGRRGFLAAAVAPAVAACRSDAASARGVAERFLDAHYVRIDLGVARELTAGLARHKIEQEVVLTAGQEIDAGTRMPRVHYRLLEETPRDDATVRLVYETTIHVDGGDVFSRTIQLTLRRAEQGWQVSNYQEY
jgi:hypothetical protein